VKESKHQQIVNDRQKLKIARQQNGIAWVTRLTVWQLAHCIK